MPYVTAGVIFEVILPQIFILKKKAKVNMNKVRFYIFQKQLSMSKFPL